MHGIVRLVIAALLLLDQAPLLYLKVANQRLLIRHDQLLLQIGHGLLVDSLGEELEAKLDKLYNFAMPLR